MKRVKICYMILGGAVPLLNAAAGSPIWVLERNKRYEWVRGKRLTKKNSTRNRLVPIFLSLVPDRDAFQLRLEEFLSLLPPEARRRKGVLYVVLPYGVRTEEGSGVWETRIQALWAVLGYQQARAVRRDGVVAKARAAS